MITAVIRGTICRNEQLMLPVVEWMLSSVRVLPDESAVKVFIGFGACTRQTLYGIVSWKKRY